MERKYKSEEIVCLLLLLFEIQKIFGFKNPECVEIVYSFMRYRYVHIF
jgi:hypothetical protein